jgi:phosphatidylserine/phosphatidylglycerophosphate/cardiolipin synthase-like enzyme
MATQIGEVSNFDWIHSGSSAGVVKLEQAAPVGDTRLEFAMNGPDASNIRAMMVRYLNQATTKIWIEVLFLDDDMVIDALVDAKRRGVDVRVVLDPLDWGNHVKELDKLPFDGVPNWAAVKDCLDAGIPVSWFNPQHEHQNMHAKIANVDDRVLIIGSANFTYRAMDCNRENSVAVESPELARQFGEVFLADEADARHVTELSGWQRRMASLFDRVKRGIYNAKVDLLSFSLPSTYQR